MRLADEIREAEMKKAMLTGEVDKAIFLLEEKRRELMQLEKEKERFIEDRKQEVEKAVAELEVKIQDQTGVLIVIKDEASEFFKRILGRADKLFDQILSLIQKADKFVSQAENLKNASESVIIELRSREKELDERIIKYSDEEKKLGVREEAVKKMAEDAQVRLKEAREVVFWLKKPGKYKEQ